MSNHLIFYVENFDCLQKSREHILVDRAKHRNQWQDVEEEGIFDISNDEFILEDHGYENEDNEVSIVKDIYTAISTISSTIQQKRDI